MRHLRVARLASSKAVKLYISSMKKILFFLFLTTLLCRGFAQVFDVDTIMYHGSDDTLINLVILGDGYTSLELDQFIDDAQQGSDALFREVPFTNYKNYFNVFAIKVPSNESGAADDPDALIDNYFGSTFNAYGIQRLLVPMKDHKISTVLAYNFPKYDHVLLLVNDSRYGGSGGWIATSSMNESAFEIIIHELGHSFAGLSDEYWAGEQYAHENINMTQETNLDQLRWKDWYGVHHVGLYPHEESPTWHRPHQSCKMRLLFSPFCGVCKSAIVKNVQLSVSPIGGYSPRSNHLYPEQGDSINFELTLIKPEPNTLKTTWNLDGFEIGNQSERLIIYTDELRTGATSISAIVEDTTSFIRSASHRKACISIVTWQVDKAATDREDLLLTNGSLGVNIFPTPFQQTLNIEFEGQTDQNYRVDVVDLLGRIRCSRNNMGSHCHVLNVSDLEPGQYMLRIYAGMHLVGTRKVIKSS